MLNLTNFEEKYNRLINIFYFQQTPVQTKCYGKHENPDWPCSDLRPYSCGRKCGRELDCKNHYCERECHTVEGSNDEKTSGTNCAPCERPCSKVFICLFSNFF